MEDLPLEKISISGATLASILQRTSSSSGDIDGLLFGSFHHISPTSLSDDDPPPSSAIPTTVAATITSFLSSSSVLTFYDSTGKLDIISLRRRLPDRCPLVGWFCGRRRTHLRPSFRESSVTASLVSHFNSDTSPSSQSYPPCVFLLVTTPFSDQPIHTHDYRAYQFSTVTRSLDSSSMDIVNIGPAFRSHYGAFLPNSQFPMLSCQLRGSDMDEDQNHESLNYVKRVAEDQKELDFCAEGFDVGNLSRLMGSDAANYTSGLEDLYEKMLAKLQSLARQVEKTSAKVFEQENHNMKLRYKVAGLE